MQQHSPASLYEDAGSVPVRASSFSSNHENHDNDSGGEENGTKTPRGPDGRDRTFLMS